MKILKYHVVGRCQWPWEEGGPPGKWWFNIGGKGLDGVIRKRGGGQTLGWGEIVIENNFWQMIIGKGNIKICLRNTLSFEILIIFEMRLLKNALSKCTSLINMCLVVREKYFPNLV